MNLNTYIKILQTQSRLLVDRVNPINAETAAQTQKQYANRIFEKGMKSDDSQLGSYNTRKTRYYRHNFLPMNYSRFKPTGFSKIRGAGVKPYMILNGYKQLKDIQGLKSSYVNLTYTGRLKANFSETPIRLSAARVTESRYGVQVNASIRTSPGWNAGNAAFNRPRTNAEKVRVLSDKYGDFMTHTIKEKISHIRRFDRLLTRVVFSATPLKGQPTIIL